MLIQKSIPSEPWNVPDKTAVRQKTLNPTWNHRMTFTTALDSAQSVMAPDKVIAIVYGNTSYTPRFMISFVKQVFAATIGTSFLTQNSWDK